MTAELLGLDAAHARALEIEAGIEDPGGYDDRCDACSGDWHHCPLCPDGPVGHGHRHTDPDEADDE